MKLGQNYQLVNGSFWPSFSKIRQKLWTGLKTLDFSDGTYKNLHWLAVVVLKMVNEVGKKPSHQLWLLVIKKIMRLLA